MKRTILIVLLCISALLSFSQDGKGAQNTLTIDMSEAGINPATITIKDVKTGQVYTAYNSGQLQVFKNGRYVIQLDMRNNETGEINYWLEWGNDREYIGITLQPGEERGVASGPTWPVDFKFPLIDFQKGATVKLTRR